MNLQSSLLLRAGGPGSGPRPGQGRRGHLDNGMPLPEAGSAHEHMHNALVKRGYGLSATLGNVQGYKNPYSDDFATVHPSTGNWTHTPKHGVESYGNGRTSFEEHFGKD